jgi:glyoxylase-like metal-dependent hydrolase (beta-lactamase superfamily II)
MGVSITPLDCGTISLDKSILTAGRGRGEVIDAPSLAFLIEGDRTMLVDTSFGDSDRMTELHYPCSRTNDQTVDAALEDAGCRPAEVDDVILTHLHWDHCYNLDQFENATIHVQRRELEYAIAPYDLHAIPYEAKSVGRRPPWLDVELTPVDGEMKLTDNVSVFPTPGHAVGHQSVAISNGSEIIVIAGDAIPTDENLEGTEDMEFIPGYNVNALEWWQSAREIDSRADRVLPCHEPRLID